MSQSRCYASLASCYLSVKPRYFVLYSTIDFNPASEPCPNGPLLYTPMCSPSLSLKVISFSSIDVRALYLLPRHHHSPCTRRVHVYRRQALAMTLHPAVQSADPKSKAQKRALPVRKFSAASKDKPRLTARGWIPCSKLDLYSTLCPSKINLDDLNRGIPRIPKRLRIPSCTPTTHLVLSSSCETLETDIPAAVQTKTSKSRSKGWTRQIERAAQLYKIMIGVTSGIESMSLADRHRYEALESE